MTLTPASPRIAATRKEEALWLLDRLVPTSGVNNLALAFRVAAALDLAVLQQAVDLLVRRHEVLRTVFHAEPDGLLREVLGAEEARVEVRELPARAGQPADEALTRFTAEPFDLDGRPLLRAGYLRHESGDHFCLAVHHLVFDTASAVVLCEELIAAYDALAAGAPVPAELLEQERALPETAPTDKSLAYWREQLAGVDPSQLELWCGTGAETDEPTLAGDRLTRPLSDRATATVRRLARELRAPEAVVLLAAYSLLLAGHGAGPDTVIGSPINVRGPQDARAIGYHVNVVPLRITAEPAESFRQLVRRTRDVFFGALTHTDVPVDNLLAEIPRNSSSWRHTLFRHVFNYVPDSGASGFSIGGSAAHPVTVENGHSKFDLEFFLLPSPDAIRLRLVYGTEVLTRADAEALADRYDTLLTALGADPERPVREVSLWSQHDRAVIAAANDTTAAEAPTEGAPATVLAAIAARASAAPDAVALEDGERRVTYLQLWQGALATAQLLREQAVTAGDVVALDARRSPELAAAVLGVWLAGAAYLPLDPDHPAQRVEYQLSDSRAAVVLAGEGVAVPPGEARTVLPLIPVGRADAAYPDTEPSAAPGAPAYLIYTSGSTGRPKGTVVSHGALANLITHFGRELRTGAEDATLWLTTFAFDISALELFLPLVTGGRVAVAPDEARVDGAVLAGLIERHEVAVVQATPTTWRLVADRAAGLLAGRRVLCGGEPMPIGLARTLLATGCELRNVYGPTETTIWSTSGLVSAADSGTGGESWIDVGRPLRNTRVFVTAPDGTELPLGVRGELCIAGDGVALGYHDRPELTAERFGEHPVHGRFYRTGDLARWRTDGTLEILGRRDRQIKLRGNRIELGEIEAVLLAHPEVRAAAVVVAGDPSADGVLIATVETGAEAGDRSALVDRLWAYARAELVGASVPHRFTVLDALPRTANDKVDYPTLARQAADWLESERAQAAAGDSPDAEPADDPLLADLIKVFQEILGHREVTPDTNFFTSGGHSLLGARLAQQIGVLTGVKIRLAEVFAHSTPSSLAERVRTALGEHSAP